MESTQNSSGQTKVWPGHCLSFLDPKGDLA